MVSNQSVIKSKIFERADISPPPKGKRPAAGEAEAATSPSKPANTEEKTQQPSHVITDAPDDEHVTEEMKMSSSSSASSLTDSEIELSDELTEVSSTGQYLQFSNNDK